jgi:hypothetical protein
LRGTCGSADRRKSVAEFLVRAHGHLYAGDGRDRSVTRELPTVARDELVAVRKANRHESVVPSRPERRADSHRPETKVILRGAERDHQRAERITLRDEPTHERFVGWFLPDATVNIRAQRPKCPARNLKPRDQLCDVPRRFLRAAGGNPIEVRLCIREHSRELFLQLLVLLALLPGLFVAEVVPPGDLVLCLNSNRALRYGIAT